MYAALWKVTGTITAARIESVSKIAGVESVETCVNAMQSRFMARAIRDSTGIVDITDENSLRSRRRTLWAPRR